jgi:phosphatidylinositol alpha-mannosyltransferase
MAAWGLQLLACYATMSALRLPGHANLAAAAAVLLAVNLTAIVPLTPANVGVFQAACIAVLHPFGVDASQALAYGLVLQAVEIVDALLLGGPALVREGLRWGELRHREDDRVVQSARSVGHAALRERRN